MDDIEDAQTAEAREQLDVAAFSRTMSEQASRLERIKIALKKAGA